jgi:DNA-binding MarR family transcriptional regulator
MAGSRAAKRAAPADDTNRPKVTYLIGRLDRALRRRISEALSPFELSVTQYTTLSVLHTRGQLSNAQLASRAFISPQSMNEVVQSLEARKFLTRRTDPSHARIVQLGLTPAGVEVVKRCDIVVRQLEQTMLCRLSAADRDALRASLSECVKVLEENANDSGGVKAAS